jgi:hypothetical protein
VSERGCDAQSVAAAPLINNDHWELWRCHFQFVQTEYATPFAAARKSHDSLSLYENEKIAGLDFFMLYARQ